MPLCAEHKGTGKTFSSKHLFMSDYKNLRMIFFFSSCVAGKENTGLQICVPLASFFWRLIWMLKSTVLVFIVTATVSVITAEAIVSHWKAAFKRWNWDFLDDWMQWKAQAEGLRGSGDAYLDDFINHRTFSAHTHTFKGSYIFIQAINRNIQIILLVYKGGNKAR